jgi:hypothetical protein
LSASFELTRQHCHQRIVTQFVVVVQILIAKRDPEHPLTDQCHHLVLNKFRTPHVVKARRKPTHHPHHPDGEICRAQGRRAASEVAPASMIKQLSRPEFSGAHVAEVTGPVGISLRGFTASPRRAAAFKAGASLLLIGKL